MLRPLNFNQLGLTILNYFIDVVRHNIVETRELLRTDPSLQLCLYLIVAVLALDGWGLGQFFAHTVLSPLHRLNIVLSVFLLEGTTEIVC